MLVSIIIPVYNVEQYVAECIESVINQDHRDLEIILVDDGSTDSSGEICDRYAEKDSRITVYHTENHGLSGARNYGTERAHGEFIHYLDSDDKFTDGAISSEVALIDGDVDIVMPKYAYWDPSIDFYDPEPYKFDPEYVEGMSGEDAFANLITVIDRPLWSAWRPMFRRSLMTDNGLSFRDRLLSEDFDLMPHLYQKARKIVLLDRVNIMYRINRNGSISTGGGTKRILDVFDIINRWEQILRSDNGYSEKFNRAMHLNMERRYFACLKKIRHLPESDKYKAISAAKPIGYLMRSRCVPFKHRILCAFLGFEKYAKLITK